MYDRIMKIRATVGLDEHHGHWTPNVDDLDRLTRGRSENEGIQQRNRATTTDHEISDERSLQTHTHTPYIPQQRPPFYGLLY